MTGGPGSDRILIRSEATDQPDQATSIASNDLNPNP
jgi:hypothetical protein